MRVRHISTWDVVGGAARAAYRLHCGLRQIGVNSSMAVAHRLSGDADVVAYDRRTDTLGARIWRGLDQERIAWQRRPYAGTLSPTLELFSDDRVAGRDAFAGGLPPAHVYNLHWVAGLLDYRRFFARLAPAKPLVWTLHDMNPLTGGCHYSLGCEGFTAQCGACAQLGSRTERDLSRRIFERKARALTRRPVTTTRIVAPSVWLAGEARRSGLLGRFHIETIPYGVDCNVFQPRPRTIGREIFGLPVDKPVVLFAADSVNNHRKGLDLLVGALKNLSGIREVTLAAIGAWATRERPLDATVALGRVENERLLSYAYSAANVFVLPTRADNLPNVVLEAMACGTPVISFDVGGVRDIVRTGQTGLLAPPEDVALLREAILKLLDDGTLRDHLSHECRRVAVSEYAIELQAQRYLGIYEALVDASTRVHSDTSVADT